MRLGEQIRDTDKLIEDRFRRHRAAPVITSMPGIGRCSARGSPPPRRRHDLVRTATGWPPSLGWPRPMGLRRIRGNLQRPRRYHRGLNRVFYYSALISIRTCPKSRAFYDRKRAEGKKHVQAVLALARRRVNVLWALLREDRAYQPRPPDRTGPNHSKRPLDDQDGSSPAA